MFFFPLNPSILVDYLTLLTVQLEEKVRDMTLTRFDRDHINVSVIFQLSILSPFLSPFCLLLNNLYPSIFLLFSSNSPEMEAEGQVSLSPFNRWGIRERLSNKCTLKGTQKACNHISPSPAVYLLC